MGGLLGQAVEMSCATLKAVIWRGPASGGGFATQTESAETLWALCDDAGHLGGWQVGMAIESDAGWGCAPAMPSGKGIQAQLVLGEDGRASRAVCCCRLVTFMQNLHNKSKV